MKKTYIEILELMLDRIDNLHNDLIYLRFDVKQMISTLKRQKTKVTNQQVQDIIDLKLRLPEKKEA